MSYVLYSLLMKKFVYSIAAHGIAKVVRSDSPKFAVGNHLYGVIRQYNFISAFYAS